MIAKKRGSKLASHILLARIMNALITSGHLEYPVNWSLNAFLKSGISYPVFKREMYGEQFDFKFLVDAKIQWLKETKLGENQRTKDLSDGSYTLEVTLHVTEELVRWILSMTSNIKVLAPKFMIKRIKSDLNKAINIYS